MKKFLIREGFPYKAKDAQIIGNELVGVQDKYGLLTPENVVTEAKSLRSPLHKYFEWDNTRAGELYRKQQAGKLIRSISIVVEYEDKAVEHQAFFNVSKKVNGRDKNIYVTVESAMNDVDSRKQILAQAIQELEYWKDKYSHLKELKLVMDAIDSSKKKVKVVYGMSKAYRSGVYKR